VAEPTTTQKAKVWYENFDEQIGAQRLINLYKSTYIIFSPHNCFLYIICGDIFFLYKTNKIKDLHLVKPHNYAAATS
jgi:hypothetical protein